MKKAFLISFLLFSFLQFTNIKDLNAKDLNLILPNDEIDFFKCYNTNLQAKSINCSSEKVTLKFNQLLKPLNPQHYGAEYMCESLPLDGSEGIRGHGIAARWITRYLERGYNEGYCEIFFSRIDYFSIDDCLEKYGVKRRQKCFDNGNFVLLKPTGDLEILACENKSLGIRSSVLSINNQQNCDELNKINEGWELVKKFTLKDYENTFNLWTKLYDYIEYTDYIKDPPLDIVKEEKKTKDKSKEEESRNKESVKPITKPEF